MLYAGVAYAMGGSFGSGGSGFVSFIPVILIFVIFYFIILRPQQRQVRRHQDFVNNLKIGDRVVTSGGMHGEVKGLTDTTITLEIADKVRVKVTRSAITGTSQDAATSDVKPA